MFSVHVALVTLVFMLSFFFQAEDGIRDLTVTGVQTCALTIWVRAGEAAATTATPARTAVARQAATLSRATPAKMAPMSPPTTPPIEMTQRTTTGPRRGT